MSERTRRYVELIAVAMIAAAFSAAAPAIAHGVRHALFAHKAGDAAKLGGKPANKYALKQTLSAPGTINALGNPMDWTKLKGVPGGFADGSDNIGPGVADNLDCSACVSESELDFAVATQAELAALQARVEELEDKLAAVSYDDGAKLFTVSGANFRIVDGSGTTDGATNGLGNLIIGYNTDTGGDTDTRSGSHNLVIGNDHTYSSFGGIIAGLNNAITGEWASVTGGSSNTASGARASVTGGANNRAVGDASSVTGGVFNTASGSLSSVTGGDTNTAGETWSSVTGGGLNTASGPRSSVTGGNDNTASGASASVTGGQFNRASGGHASVTGGASSTATGSWASVTGGASNTASGSWASVTGGNLNTASGLRSAVTGGVQNVADAVEEWVSGTLFARNASVAVPAGATEGNGSYFSEATQALCNANEQFVGGGASWDIDADDKELNVVSGQIATVGNQVGWRVRGGNDTADDHVLTVQVYCLGS